MKDSRLILISWWTPPWNLCLHDKKCQLVSERPPKPRQYFFNFDDLIYFLWVFLSKKIHLGINSSLSPTSNLKCKVFIYSNNNHSLAIEPASRVACTWKKTLEHFENKYVLSQQLRITNFKNKNNTDLFSTFSYIFFKCGKNTGRHIWIWPLTCKCTKNVNILWVIYTSVMRCCYIHVIFSK